MPEKTTENIKIKMAIGFLFVVVIMLSVLFGTYYSKQQSEISSLYEDLGYSNMSYGWTNFDGNTIADRIDTLESMAYGTASSLNGTDNRLGKLAEYFGLEYEPEYINEYPGQYVKIK